MAAPVPPRPLVLAWANVREATRSRMGSGSGGRDLPSQVLYTPYICSQLQLHGLAPFDGIVAPSEWHLAMTRLDGHLLGLLLLRPLFVHDVFRRLSPEQDAVRQYWRHTRWRDESLAYFEVLASVTIVPPQVARRHLVGPTGNSLFFEVTEFSARAAWGAIDAEGQGVPTIVARWAQAFNAGQAFDQPSPVKLALNMPAPHAMLATAGAWSSYGFPWTGGNSGRSHGMHLIRNALSTLEAPRDGQLMAGIDDHMNPHLLQSIVGLLQDACQGAPAYFRDDVYFRIVFLQRLIDNLRAEEAQTGKKTFDMLFLIECIVTSGFLKDSRQILPVMEHALACVVPDPSIRKYYSDRLREKHRLPGRSTVYRHRLTLHIGWCQVEAELIAALLAGDPGCPSRSQWITIPAARVLPRRSTCGPGSQAIPWAASTCSPCWLLPASTCRSLT